MTYAIAQAEPVLLLSWLKPLLFVAALGGWAWVASKLDKDAEYYYLNQHWLNMGQLAVGAIGFALMIFIPIFLVGFVLGLIVLGGGILGYAAYRNAHVPEKARWSFSLESFTQRIDEYQQDRAQRRTSVKLLRNGQEPVEVPTGDEPYAEAHATLEHILPFAIDRGAQRLDVSIDTQQATVTVWVDGVKYVQPPPDPQDTLHLVDYVKLSAGLDPEDRRKRQSARLGVDVADKGYHQLGLETAGSTRGVWLTLEINPVAQRKIPLEHLGLLDGQRQQLNEVLQQRGGVVLVAAPQGQGASTTLYAMLERHDPYTSSIVTLEQQPVYEVDGVDHHRLEDASAQEVGERLGALLRADPAVVMLARLTDEQAAKMLARSGTDVRIYTSLDAPDTFSALSQWVRLVGERKRAGQALGAILAQRLVRKLCPTCRVAYKPDPAALKKLNLPPDKIGELYRASGQVKNAGKPQTCPACNGIGYRGREAIFELMPLDDAARELIVAGDTDRLRGHLRKRRMLWLQEVALAKVTKGVTDIKEVTRVLGGKQPDDQAAQPQPTPADSGRPSQPQAAQGE